MKIAVSTDERTELVETLLKELNERHHTVEYIGPEAGEDADWPEVTCCAAELVASGASVDGIVMCWTVSGSSIAVNKVKGIRADSCRHAETAKGARIWNHANVLALSLQATSESILKEILDAWFSTKFSDDEWNLEQIERIRHMETKLD